MNPPSPAIVAQNAVRSLPRWMMLLLCAAYVLAGFVGRGPWRDLDMSTFGYMRAMAEGSTSWWQPTLHGLAPENAALLPYWLGAWAIQLLPAAVPADLAVRLPFTGLLVLTLVCAWWSVFNLARMPGAQPVVFAFGGEASPNDYARAVADGGLLALLACLGLAQLSHETTRTAIQLCATCALCFAAAGMWWQPRAAAAAALLGLLVMSLAGAPAMGLCLGLGAVVLCLCVRQPKLANRYSWAAWWLLSMAVAGCAAWALGLWEWRLINPWEQGKAWQSLARLMMWFSWPAWPLALWTLWRWRQQLAHPWHNPHLALPLWLWVLAAFATVFTLEADRALLLALPGIAALAAFALPTFKRSIAALIDWMTLVFFTVCAITIWVVWIAVQTGVPAKPAANVARLAVGFVPSFSLFPFLVAVAATVGWLLLVAWRTRRHRAAIWKTVAVPAGGTVLGWVLLMTLWLPMLDYARSYAPHVQAVVRALPADAACVQARGLSRGQLAAFDFHSDLRLHTPNEGATPAHCNWLIATPQAWSATDTTQADAWQLVARVARPTDRNDYLLVLQRVR